MQLEIYILLPILVGLCLITFFLGWYIQAKINKSKVDGAENTAKRILTEAESKSKEIISEAEKRSRQYKIEAEKSAHNLKKEKLLEVKDEFLKRKQKFDEETRARDKEISEIEKKTRNDKENIEKIKNDLLNKTRDAEDVMNKYNAKLIEVNHKETDLNGKISEYDELIIKQKEQIQQIAGMTEDEAKTILMENMINKAKLEAAAKLQDIREETKIESNKISKNIVVQAIQRSAVDHSVETTVSVLQITSDELKGRIIGKEGRNIRAFEAVTGVDIIVDDTPEAVIISAFDPFRREVARVAMERLIADGRIHPARIEEVVQKVEKELNEEIIKVGEQTLIEMGVQGVNRDIITLIGRMKYRSSYGQNVLNHSMEVGQLASVMAAELGLDPILAKRAGLFHDIGKTVDRSIEGPHAILGYEIAKRSKEHPIVCNAIGAHHDEMPMEHPIAVLVQAADAISGSRPGARRESVEAYSKRLEKLEQIATSFEGVAKTYAIQAGREVRVIVEHDKISDMLQDQLADDIAHKIQEEMEYPGQIKVNVIRERRSIAYAK